MAKKLIDGFGKTPRVKVSISEADMRRLSTHEWFIEYLNIDTRNAIAQALGLVNHEGDQIFYGGREVHGFKVDMKHVLFLYNSIASNTWKFTPYHRPVPRQGNWSIWKMGRKAPPERLRNMSHFFRKGENPLKE